MTTQAPTEITARDARELNDPLGGLIAEEVARHWYEIATSDPSKLQAKLAEQEQQLRSPGGVGWALHVLSGSLTHRLGMSIHPLLKQCLPLPAATVVAAAVEEFCREAYTRFLDGFAQAQLCRDSAHAGDRFQHVAAEAFALRDSVRESVARAVAAA